MADPFARLLSPPAAALAPVVQQAAGAPALQTMTEEELIVEILGRIAAAEQRPLHELEGDPKHIDGTVAIDSMTAVSALASIGGTVGRPRLVDLSRVDREDLRSVAGLARLARRALDGLVSGSVA